MDEIYRPREDSELLRKYVQKYSKGIVLDVGTGSGIQALEAAKSKKVTKVYAVDINKDAIQYCRKNIQDKKVVFFTSDLFSIFRRNKRYKDIKFDTILFNAPYLPSDENDPNLAEYGGKKGFEIFQRFFYEAEEFIKPRTKILIIFSSLSKKDRIEKIIKKHKLSFKELEKIHIFFEDIYCYLIKK